MSVYSLQVTTQLLSKTQNNVWFYRTTNPGVQEGSANGCLDAFVNNVLTPLKNAVSTGTTFVSAYCYDLFFPANIGSAILSGTGARAGDQFAPHVTATMRTNRASRAIRRGQKRFGGTVEGDAANGVWAAAYLTILATLGAAMALTITSSGTPGISYIPVVVKRIFVPASGSTPAHYRLPTVIGEYSAFDITSWEANQRVTSQNSRKLPYLA